MDAGVVKQRIEATLTPDDNVRRQAELDLRHAEEQQGFITALVQILRSEQNNGIQQATVVYLKNRITKAWNPADDYPEKKRIKDDERQVFRDQLIPLLADSPPLVRSQLIPVLQTILHTDFPEKWPGIFDTTVRLLSAQTPKEVYAGLQCILGICRVYRFKSGENRQEFENGVVAGAFPQLLNMGNALVQEDSLEAGEMLRAVMKAFKHAVYFELPVPLREHNAILGWCTLFIKTVQKDPPACSMSEDLDERETNHWWKAKKWAYANLNRLFVRYGNPATLTKNSGEEYAVFSKMFLEQFAPEILKIYLGQIEKWVAKQTWLSKTALSHTLTYLDECVKPKIMWAHLKDHIENLISHLVFPVLCLSDEDLELFETEPQEYLHRKLNFYEQVQAPDVAAMNFLISLTKHRKKQTFTALKFVNEVVNKYEQAPEDQKNPREKEGALKMIGTLASVILGKKSPIADQVEYFFVRHVFPEFRSSHGYLRARACDTLEKFEQLDFKDESNLVIAYRSVLTAMADNELPVRVEAALALQPLIRHDTIRNSMQENIPQIMQQLLKLANEVDVDALANVMEDFVEVFATELTPYAVALTEQLRDTYLRIVKEVVERSGDRDDPDEILGFTDDKSVTALGVLQTIGTLILTLESSPDVLHHLEALLMPLISITLESKLYDLYTEVFEIIDSCTFASKSISPSMWQAFELMHTTFKNGGELYLEDMLPAFENIIQFGAPDMAKNPKYIEATVDIIRTIFEDKKLGGVDRICGCKLAEALMLSLRGQVDEYIGDFIRIAMTALTSQELKVKSYRVHLVEMVVNAIYYNAQLSLSILEMSQTTARFFSVWYAHMDSFTRVHDKKLSIAAIASLLTMPASAVPQSAQEAWPSLLKSLVKLFSTLPAAEKNREEAKADNEFSLNSDYEDEDENWDEGDEWGEYEGTEETEDVKDESSAYLDFLSEEAAKFSGQLGDDDDDELEEESLLETPLDTVEPYAVLKGSLMKLQQEQPQFYENLMKQLEQNESSVLQAAVGHADTLAAQQAAAANTAAQANGSS